MTNTTPLGAGSTRDALGRWWAAWDRRWFSPQPLLALGLLRILAFATLLWYLASEYAWVIRLENVDPWYYRPILAFTLLGIGPIPNGFAGIIRAILVLGAMLGLLGVFARTSAALCGVGYLYSIGQVYSFTNVHHGDGLLGLVLLALTLCPTGKVLAIPTPWNRWGTDLGMLTDPGPGWPMYFVRVQIALVYCLAGYAKLVLTGPVWADGASLQHYLILRGQPIGYWLAAQPLLCAALSTLTFAWELSFPLVLRWPRLRWVYVPMAIVFHLVSQHVLSVGFMYFWPFLLAYIDPAPLLRWWRARRARAIQGPQLSTP